MHHYTYEITYKSGKKYIGVRSCKCLPEEDVKYVGSSKHTPNKTEIVSKLIINNYLTRKEALLAEIQLHREKDIANNPDYYNRAIQTSTGFDTTGVAFKRSKEHILKIKKALTGRKRSPEECLAISKGKKGKSRKPHSLETKDKLSKANIGKIVSSETIAKMVSTRKANNTYKQSEKTREKISKALLINHPNTKQVSITINDIEYIYTSINSCARNTGKSIATLKQRLKRIPGKTVNNWSIKYI